MKKIAQGISIFLIFVNLQISKATIIEITAAGADINTWAFVPANPTVSVGDTLRWLNLNGVHTTASSTIPAGAAAWDASIPTDGVNYFDYVVTVEGEYRYTCHKSLNGGAGHGMDGAFRTTGAATDISENEPAKIYSLAFPVPFSSVFNIQVEEGDFLKITDAGGKEIQGHRIESSPYLLTLNLEFLPSGNYVYSLFLRGTLLESKSFIKF